MSARYAEAAKALHEIADRMAALADRDLPEPMYITFGIQPGGPGLDGDRDPAVVTAAIDTVARALLDITAATRQLSDDHWHHKARARVGPIWVSVYDRVQQPVPSPAARLRAAEAVWRWGAAA